MTNLCLYCYQGLQEGEKDFHAKCSRTFFGTEIPPVLNYTLDELLETARERVLQSITVTGVQPKLTVTIEKGKPTDPKRSRFSIAGLLGGYILKPPPASFPHLPENEDLTMHLAKYFEIRTALHSLIRLKSGELVYITKRFDRENDNKLAMEDMCQLTETLTENKYKGSVEKIAKVISAYSSNTGFDRIQFFHTLLFCFITGNSDMHLKNYSLLTTTGNNIELAPAYDLVNVKIAFPDDGEESALTINGRRNRLQLKDFDALAENMKLDPRVRDQIYNSFKSKMKLVHQLINFSFLPDAMKTRYMEVMDEKAKKLGWLN
jgi:serine/threonine-protein kinase HipA